MDIPSLEEMVKLGLHFGHQRTYSHPRSKSYVFVVRNGFCIIDLEKTREKLEEALLFLKQSAKEKKNILFVGSKEQIQDKVIEKAKELSLPYIKERWQGGTLTNFETLKKNIEKLESLKEQEKNKEGMTKKEFKKLEKEREKLENLLGGLKELKELPDVLFVVDAGHEKIAINEANKLGIKTVAICNTNTDPTKIDYPIVCNDNSKKGVEFLLDLVAESIKEGQTPLKAQVKARGKRKKAKKK